MMMMVAMMMVVMMMDHDEGYLIIKNEPNKISNVLQ
jgi:hypothetical protein